MDHRVYQICVKGVLDRAWAEWFEGLAIRPTENGNTILEGPLPDQSALYGILDKLSNLGLVLISAHLLEPKR
jgi:hypothetical protein